MSVYIGLETSIDRLRQRCRARHKLNRRIGIRMVICRLNCSKVLAVDGEISSVLSENLHDQLLLCCLLDKVF